MHIHTVNNKIIKLCVKSKKWLTCKTCVINWYVPAIGAVNIPVPISIAPELELDSLTSV